MALTKKQMELDKIKWLKSEEMGKDACGSFDYCKECDMNKENPCDNALKLYNKIMKLNAKEPAKATAKAEAKPATKKAPAKKTATKKASK